MAARKALPWTVSVWGRRVLRGVAASVMGGTFLAHYLPHTWLIHKTREITQIYRRGLPIPVPASVTQLVEEVMEEMVMTEEARTRINLYTCFGFELFHAGSSRSSHGAILGLPSSIRWEDVGAFDPTGVMVNNESVPWSTEAGERLKGALILSRNAKKFVIARELHGIQTNSIASQALIPTMSLFMAYTISLGINKRLNLYGRPRGLRVCLYGLASLFGYGIYILGTDLGAVKKEENGDAAAGKLGKAYAEGGVEFYEKILKRNTALRELMGKQGESLYTAMGNDEILFRTKHLPFTVRLDNMKKCLKQYEETPAAGDGKNGEEASIGDGGKEGEAAGKERKTDGKEGG